MIEKEVNYIADKMGIPREVAMNFNSLMEEDIAPKTLSPMLRDAYLYFLKNVDEFLEKYRAPKKSKDNEVETLELTIKDVIFSKPATIVKWGDGTKTVVKAQNKEKFDAEKGLAMAIIKKLCGNTGAYYEIFKTYCEDQYLDDEKPVQCNACSREKEVSEKDKHNNEVCWKDDSKMPLESKEEPDEVLEKKKKKIVKKIRD